MSDMDIAKTLDVRGLSCPMPSVKTSLALDKIETGEVIEVITDDPVSRKDLPRWAESTDNEIVKMVEDGDETRIYIRKSE